MMIQREEERRITFTVHKHSDSGTDVITLSCQNLAAFFRICPFAYFNLGMLGVGKAQLVPL